MEEILWALIITWPSSVSSNVSNLIKHAFITYIFWLTTKYNLTKSCQRKPQEIKNVAGDSNTEERNFYLTHYSSCGIIYCVTHLYVLTLIEQIFPLFQE